MIQKLYQSRACYALKSMLADEKVNKSHFYNGSINKSFFNSADVRHVIQNGRKLELQFPVVLVTHIVLLLNFENGEKIDTSIPTND